jgi:hypothetical protein
MEEKTVFEDLLDVKQRVDQMDLLEFKHQWEHQVGDYAHLTYRDRLKFTVMSIKILQAKVDLIRTISSIRELANHPEPERALYYYLRSNLWKFLDNFRYILLVKDISDQIKLDCMDLLDEITDIIAQDDQLKSSSLSRLHKLLVQIKLLEQHLPPAQEPSGETLVHAQLDRRVSQVIQRLEPQPDAHEDRASADIDLPAHVHTLLSVYSAFSVSRISIERSGIASIIQLLSAHPLKELEVHARELFKTLTRLEREVLIAPGLRALRNQCAYALVILQEMRKMHNGLPVLLLKILQLCTYVQSPPAGIQIPAELAGLKPRITTISQKKLRPLLEDVLWKNPEYFIRLPHLKTVCPWCYPNTPQNTPDIQQAQQLVSASFDRLFVNGNGSSSPSVGASRLSQMIVEILGLLVNIEPSPNFLKTHAHEALQIKHAKDELPHSATKLERLLDQQLSTYKQHLQFLQESLDYYQSVLDQLKNGGRPGKHEG